MTVNASSTGCSSRRCSGELVTARDAHGLAATLARTAASRTLTTADLSFRLPSDAPLTGGLASVG